MKPVQITAYLSNGIVVNDDWSPQLEGVVIYHILEEKGLLSPNPTKEQVRETDEILSQCCPLLRDKEHGFYYCSSPVYQYVNESQSRYRKRWSPGEEGRINWGKRKAKFSTSEGAEKAYDLPLSIRLTSRIDWYGVGDLEDLQRILNKVKGLGKKRSQGYGQVYQWEVKETEQDWSISREGTLMKPLPGEIIANSKKFTEKIEDLKYNLLRWGWRPPSWLNENKEMCLMPNSVSLIP